MSIINRDVLKEYFELIYQFRKEVSYNNRFFPKETRLLGEIDQILNKCSIEIEKNTLLYRARIFEDDSVYMPLYTEQDMGMPPNSKSSGGRANPEGISYLYLATDIETAIAEARPWKKAKINIATFVLNEKLSVFYPIKYLVDNYNNPDINQQQASLSFILDYEFSTPINPNKKNDYLVTQIIAEFVKAQKFDGIYYESALGPKHNLVLFNQHKVTIQPKIRLFETNNISYTSNEIEVKTPMSYFESAVQSLLGNSRNKTD